MKPLTRILNGITLNLPKYPFFAGKRTPIGEVRSLIKALHPMSTNIPLIRLGPKEDGGYLVPDDLEGVTCCFSPGVYEVSGFEKDCAQRGMDIHMADASVNKPAEDDERFHFRKSYIGSYEHDKFITMEQWVMDAGDKSDDDWILQIDIEGWEYEVLLNMHADLINKFRIIVIEMHSLDQLFESRFFSIANSAFRKLLANHTCVHIHPNNNGHVQTCHGLSIPSLMEFTFIRNDRIEFSNPTSIFPHTLDADNMIGEKSIILPRCWFG